MGNVQLHGIGANNIIGTVANGGKPVRRMVYEDYFYTGTGNVSPIQPALR